MTTEVLSQTIGAGGTATFGAGRIFYVKTASSPLTIVAEKAGNASANRRFSNMPAGAKFKAEPGDGWTYLRVTSAIAQTIEMIVGDDDVELSNAVSVTGGVATSEAPSTTLVTPVQNQVNTAVSAAVAANLLRRRITVCGLSTNTGSLFIRVTGTAGTSPQGLELQPGQLIELKTTASFDIRNDTGAQQTYTLLEET